jgi:thiol-disulfide isomerase/thioredoxin
MKKIFLSLLVFIALRGYSQPILVDGYINNAQGLPVNLLIDKNYLGIHSQTISVNTSEGNFSFALHEEQEIMATLSYGTEAYPFFLAPGDTLHMAFTADLLAITIRFSGNAAGENIFLKNFNKKFAEAFTDSLMNNKMLTTGVDAFEIDIYNMRKKELEYLKADSSYGTFSPAFKDYFTNLVNYRYWNLLLAYPIEKANSSSTVLKVDELPAPLLEGFEKVKASNAEALICDSYRTFLKYYVIYFTSKLNGFNKFKDFNLSMERKNVFAQASLSGTPYQYWLSRFILEDFEKAQPSTVKRLYNSLVQSEKQPVYSSIVKEKCGAYMEKKDVVKQVAATPSSGISSGDEGYRIVDEKGKSVKFSDFKGKAIYVDFWASWCGPCRQQMPFSKELHKKFSDKQLKSLVFLYISIDNDSAAWRKAVKDIGMEGFQAISPANWSDGAGNFFYVNSIPRYMLIDKTGKVVDDNAKRPSDPSVFQDILNLIE